MALERPGQCLVGGEPAGLHQVTFFAGASRKMGYNLSHGNADKYAIAHRGARALVITTALLGLGLITFAIDASNTQLILPQVMTSMRVDLYEIHWILTAPGIARAWSSLPPRAGSPACGARAPCT